MHYFFFSFLLLFMSIHHSFGLSPRYAAIVIDAHSGKVLQQENADKIRHPASLTKMMTLYLVFEALKSKTLHMNTRVYVSAHAARQIPCKLGLRQGEYVSVDTIIKGIVTKSANDASAAIAEHLGGSESNFASMMTQKARILGMKSTLFKNSSGVPNSQQVTTARDMAILSRSLYLHFPKDYRHFRLKAFYHRGRTHKNHNHLLSNRRGLDIDGIKTGYVAASGFNLAASAIRTGPDHKPKRLIAVVLGGPNRHWRDRRVADLLEANFDKLGLGDYGDISVKTKGNDDDDDDDEDVKNNEVENRLDEDEDDDVVKAFLKVDNFTKPERASSQPIRPISVTWPPKQQMSTKVDSDADSWGVQVGTYTSLKEATIRARKVLAQLKSGEISTPRVTTGRRPSYGARLLGISKADAQAIYKRYTAQGIDCRLLAAN